MHGELVGLPAAIGVATVAGNRAMTRVSSPMRGRAVHVPVAGEGYSIRSTLNGTRRSLGFSDVLDRQQVLGAEPDEAAVVAGTRFTGGEPMKVATKVSAGSS